MLEAAIALAVAGDIGRGLLANGERRGSPDIAILLVAQIDGLARRIDDRIVRPGRELILLAVDRPAVATALGGDLEAEGWIGDHIDPGRGRGLAPAEDRHIFPPVGAEAAQPVEMRQLRAARCRLRHAVGGRAAGGRHRIGGHLPQALHLLGDAAATAEQHRPRHRLERRARIDRDQIGSQDEDFPPDPFAGPRLAHPRRGLDAGLEILGIGRRPLVQDHQIDGKLLHAPIFMGAEELADDLHIGDLVDPHENDGQIAGDAVGPQDRRAEVIALQRVR